MTVATKDEKERLSIVETKVDQQGKDISEIKGDVKTILGRFDIVLGLRAEIDALKVEQTNQKASSDAELAAFKASTAMEIKNLKAAKFRNAVVYPALGLIIGGTLTALILSALNK